MPTQFVPAPINSAQIITTNEEHEYFFREGCQILEMLNQSDDPTLSIARARVEAGVKTKNHHLRDTTERYVILQGEARVSVGDIVQDVGVGDTVIIPAGCPQCIENTASVDLVFLAICTPRFLPENYTEIT